MLPLSILLFCRLTILLVFAWAIIGKAQDVTAFREAVVDFHVLPSSWSRVFAWVFLGAEALVVLCMLIGLPALLFVGFLLAAALLLAFALALSMTLARKMTVVCNCFGRTTRYVSPYDVARNGLLLLCPLTGLWLLRFSMPPASGTALLLMGCMAIAYGLLSSNLANIIETLRKPISLQ